jgi:hypothetical protein
MGEESLAWLWIAQIKPEKKRRKIDIHTFSGRPLRAGI